jgi:uncharacterized repeat protein (TIGR02543 family)
MYITKIVRNRGKFPVFGRFSAKIRGFGMKDKKVFVAILTAALILGMTACDDEGIEVFVTGVNLNTDKLSLVVGGTETLTATVEPSDATNKAVIWSSSDTAVATVSGGVVTGVKAGTATITVTTVYGVKRAYCTVTVTNAVPVPVTGVTLRTSSAVIVGDSTTLTATVMPTNATNQAVTWSSGNSAVATVEGSGVTATVTGVAEGNATITVKTQEGNFTATCTVTVSVDVVPVTGVTLDEESLNLVAGETYTLNYSIEPETATTKGVKFTSDDTAVATVSQAGVVTAVATGSTYIMITADDTTYGEKNDYCIVTVTVPVSGVNLDETELSLAVGGTETLTATVEPPNAKNKNVTWKSNKPTVARVVGNGLTATVTGVAVGTADITVTADDDINKTATCKVTVSNSVTGVNLPSTSGVIVGGTTTLSATVTPTNATNKALTWSSSDTDVATVTNGKVTGVAVGTAVITVTTDDGSFTASCSVTVSDKVVPVTGVTLNKNSIGSNSSLFYVGYKTETLIANIAPGDATNTNLTWTSSNYLIADVTQSGEVTGVSDGTATITVTTEDGGKTANCTVRVSTAAVTGVNLNNESLILNKGDTNGFSLTAIIEPEYATNKNVTWKSSDITVATVDTNGLVTPVATGRATITVTTVDGNKTRTCVVTVNIPVENVTLAPSADLAVGASVTLTPTITPPNASNKTVTWSSGNDDSIATVSTGGVVTGVAAGTTAITVTTNDGGKTAICAVKVTVPVTGVTLSKNTTTILVGMSEILIATVAPANASDRTVIWRINPTGIATVTNGTVTGVKAGTATITVTTANGGQTDTCTVTVPTTYIVTFNSNGGYFSKPSEISVTTRVASNDMVSPPATKPTKDKDIFNGWYKDLETSTAYDFDTQKVTENITLYAKWIPKVEMVSIPSGRFNLGSPENEPGRFANEGTQRAVDMSAFLMGKFEVTQEQYEAVMGKDNNPSDFDGRSPGKEAADWEEQGKRPVESVSWYEAIVFCNKLSIAEGLSPAYSIAGEKDPAVWIENNGNTIPTDNSTWNAVTIVSGSNGYRLPTEAQWEYACRAGTITAFYTGDTAGFNTGWYGGTSGNSGGKTHQVGLKLPNAWGLYDMHGNVFEWCWDWFNAYTSQQNADPTGPATGTQRVRRGGCWNQSADNMRSAYRSSHAEPNNKTSQVGFRVARPQ